MNIVKRMFSGKGSGYKQILSKRVIAIQGWWVEKSGTIRAKLEEMKHI